MARNIQSSSWAPVKAVTFLGALGATILALDHPVRSVESGGDRLVNDRIVFAACSVTRRIARSKTARSPGRFRESWSRGPTTVRTRRLTDRAKLPPLMRHRLAM
jgi:hypothetical protein